MFTIFGALKYFTELKLYYATILKATVHHYAAEPIQ